MKLVLVGAEFSQARHACGDENLGETITPLQEAAEANDEFPVSDLLIGD